MTSNPSKNAFVDKTCFPMEGHTDLMTSDDDDDEPFVKKRKNDAGHLGCTNIERLMVIQG